MLLQVVFHQAYSLPGSKAAELAAVAEVMLPPMLIECWPAREGLLAGPTLQPWVLFTGVSSQAGRTRAEQATVGTVQGALSDLYRTARGRRCGFWVSSQSMLLKCCF